jgi:hypothetical protein
MEYPKNFSRRIKAFGFPEKRMGYASGHAWQTMDRPELRIKSGEKRWALKHFSPWGVIRAGSTSLPNAGLPAAIRR